MAKGNKAALPEEQDYQASDDMRTLMRAHQIRNHPTRHAAAKAHAAKQLEAMRAIGTPLGESTVGEPAAAPTSTPATTRAVGVPRGAIAPPKARGGGR